MPNSKEDSPWVDSFREKFHEAINDDLNTPQALAVALEMVNKAYRDHDHRVWNTLKKFDDILGLGLEDRRTQRRVWDEAARYLRGNAKTRDWLAISRRRTSFAKH